MKIFALSTIAASALAFQHANTGDVEHYEGTPVDLDASTKLVGIIGWAKIIDELFNNTKPSNPSCADGANTCTEDDEQTDPTDLPDGDGDDTTGGNPGADNYKTARDYYICAYRW